MGYIRLRETRDVLHRRRVAVWCSVEDVGSMARNDPVLVEMLEVADRKNVNEREKKRVWEGGGSSMKHKG